MTDTGRGTFSLTGRPIADAETLAQLVLADDESAVEVPKRERKFYGATAASRSVPDIGHLRGRIPPDLAALTDIHDLATGWTYERGGGYAPDGGRVNPLMPDVGG